MSFKTARAGAVLVAALVISLPIAFLTTILLIPLWSWIEAKYGIESIGHSGPADWCYATVYTMFVLLSAVFLWLVTRRLRT